MTASGFQVWQHLVHRIEVGKGNGHQKIRIFGKGLALMTGFKYPSSDLRESHFGNKHKPLKTWPIDLSAEKRLLFEVSRQITARIIGLCQSRIPVTVSQLF